MIQSVSSFKKTNSKTNLKYASSVAFKGNPLSLVRDEVVLRGKVSKTMDIATESVGKKLKGLTDELPMTRKAKTAADLEDEADEMVQNGVEVVGDALGNVVPLVGPGIRAIKTVGALAEGDLEKAGKQVVGFGKSVVKQTVAATIAAATGPFAPLTYIAANVVMNKSARKAIAKWWRNL